MKSLRKAASVIAGGVLLGSVLGSMASATLDQTGLSKGFFYDDNYNPIAQIVVGQNGLAPDSVAAGNIAAVLGNLAYSSKQTTIALDPTAEGRVVLGVSALGAVGKYEQADHGSTFKTYISQSNSLPMIAFDSATNARSNSEPSSFYKDSEGLNWTHGDEEVYEKGEFVTYSLSCETQRTDAGILKEATYNNIHCLFCETLCLEQLENPEHEMSESIMVDWAQMRWFEDGINSKAAEALTLKIPSRAVEYRVDTQCILIEKIEKSTDTVDFEWRGKLLLFGDEYYVKNIKGEDKVYLAKGKVLDDVTSEGYTSEYLGYKFKIDHLIYSAEFQVAGILLDVEKPDGTVVQTQISKLANGVVDDIEIAGVYAEESDAVATASILVYDTSTNVLLENNKDIELGGEVKKYWKVMLNTGNAAASDDITEYASTTGTCLENITVQYRHSISLAEGESLQFPATFVLTFSGYKQNDFQESACSGAGEGNIKIEKYGDYIALLSFTGDDGQRYDMVRMDEGPFETGSLFIVGGTLYEYDSYEQDQQTSTNQMKVVLKNVLNGGKNTYRLNAYYGASDFNITTYSFEESAENDETTLVEVEDGINDTDVFAGTIEGVAAMWVSGALAFGDTTVALDGNTFGTFTKFDDNGNSLSLTIVNENTTLDKNKDGQAADRLIVLSNEQGEYAIIDLYDRSYNSSANNNVKYKEGLIATDQWTSASGIIDSNISIKLDDEDDVLAILPDGGTSVTLDYGSNSNVNSFSVCHPQDSVYGTAFIGTSEQETLLEAVITKDDEGKEQTVGCCTYTVKSFEVTATSSSQTVTERTMNPIGGGLVVPESAADISKNLIIVGGPAVNTMSTVTADQLLEADDQYIVRKDGSKVIVAGYNAEDTVSAGNALIAWLQENAHA